MSATGNNLGGTPVRYRNRRRVRGRGDYDSAMLDTLCEAVRLVREYSDAVKMKDPRSASLDSTDWRSVADDLAAALEKLDSQYRSEQDPEASVTRPEWLRRPWQRYHRASTDSANKNVSREAELEAAQRGVRLRVFPSMIDWLDQEVPAEWLARFLALIHETPQLDWLLLTKRPHLWRDRIESAYDAATRETQTEAAGDALLAWLDCLDMPERGDLPPNIWLGVSAEDQKRWDERVPALLRIPAAVRFVSVEPMLERIDMQLPAFSGLASEARPCGGRAVTDNPTVVRYGTSPDWVIYGGESGPGARPCNIEWIRDGLRQCREAGVPAFVKQLGSKPIGRYNEAMNGWPEHNDPLNPIVPFKYRDAKGGDPAEWPEDLRVREWPATHKCGEMEEQQ